MSVTPGDLLVAVMAHHIAAAEIGGLSEWIVSGVWHALWTALVPALLMGAVLISTGFSAASVRLLSSRPPSLADPLANRTAGPGAGRD